MKNIFYLSVIGFALLAAQCKKNNGGEGNPDPGDSTTWEKQYDPVENGTPNTDYEPAFEGQTRAPGLKTETDLDIKVISSSLSSPWGIATMPDGRLLITQKAGTMIIAGTDGSLSSPIAGLPDVNASGQGGLLDVEVDPLFSSNRMVYWTFSENFEGGTVTSIAKGRLSDDETEIEDATVIFRAIPSYAGTMHYGSRIEIDNSGNLLVSTGERSDLVTRPQAQDLNSGLGKILRITSSGAPAAGNPFATGAMPEIYSYGHRNVQSLAYDKLNDVLWEAELGPRGGDEINKIEAGRNYGWPVITYGLEYSGVPVGAGITQQAGMEQPVYYWDPVISPSGMILYTSSYIPEWQGCLLIGALNGQHIARIKFKDGKVYGEERLLADEGQRFRSLAQGLDGIVYAITDAGRLYRIGKAE